MKKPKVSLTAGDKWGKFIGSFQDDYQDGGDDDGNDTPRAVNKLGNMGGDQKYNPNSKMGEVNKGKDAWEMHRNKNRKLLMEKSMSGMNFAFWRFCIFCIIFMRNFYLYY